MTPDDLSYYREGNGMTKENCEQNNVDGMMTKKKRKKRWFVAKFRKAAASCRRTVSRVSTLFQYAAAVSPERRWSRHPFCVH